MSEHQLAAAVRERLALMGCWVEGVNAQARGRFRSKPILGKGAPDIMVLDRGVAIAFETKKSHTPTCICSSCEDQRHWAKRWREAGGVYEVVRSVEAACYIVSVVRDGMYADRRTA